MKEAQDDCSDCYLEEIVVVAAAVDYVSVVVVVVVVEIDVAKADMVAGSLGVFVVDTHLAAFDMAYLVEKLVDFANEVVESCPAYDLVEVGWVHYRLKSKFKNYYLKFKYLIYNNFYLDKINLDKLKFLFEVFNFNNFC